MSVNESLLANLIKIDDTNPFVPEGWTVKEHRRINLDSCSGIELYLSEKQKNGLILGLELQKELKDRPVLNACHLDGLLADQKSIPEDWKDKVVYFWGTIYCDSNGDLYVRYLGWFGKWDWCFYWLGSTFNSDSPAILASFPST